MPDDKLRHTVDFTQAYLTNYARAYVLHCQTLAAHLMFIDKLE